MKLPVVLALMAVCFVAADEPPQAKKETLFEPR
jgi:hypothetical protein